MTRRHALIAVATLVAYQEGKTVSASPQAQQKEIGLPPSLLILDGRPIVAVVKFQGQSKTVTSKEIWDALNAKESSDD